MFAADKLDWRNSSRRSYVSEWGEEVTTGAVQASRASFNFITRDAAVHRLGVKHDLTWAIYCTSKTSQTALPSIFFFCAPTALPSKCTFLHSFFVVVLIHIIIITSRTYKMLPSNQLVVSCKLSFPCSWSNFCNHHKNEQVILNIHEMVLFNWNFKFFQLD